MENKEIMAAPAQSITPMTMLDKLLTSNAELDKIEKFMDLAERHEKTEAKKAYVAAMARFKAEQPKVYKDKKGHNSQYASLANITDSVCPVLGKYGLSARWGTVQTEEIEVTCTITHELGHSESTSLRAQPDTSGSKNSIQAIGSTVSYLERYTFCALLGIAGHDMDDDGNKGATKFVTEDQLNELESMINESLSHDDTFKDRMLKYLKCENMASIPAAKYQVARQSILNAIKKVQNGNQ